LQPVFIYIFSPDLPSGLHLVLQIGRAFGKSPDDYWGISREKIQYSTTLANAVIWRLRAGLPNPKLFPIPVSLT
jgi:hypothetical protein